MNNKISSSNNLLPYKPSITKTHNNKENQNKYKNIHLKCTELLNN